MAKTVYDDKQDYSPAALKEREQDPHNLSHGADRGAVNDEFDKLTSPEHLSKDGKKPGEEPGGGLYKPEGGTPQKATDTKKGGSKYQKALGVLKKNKIKFIAGGGVLVAPFIALLLLQLGSLLLPNLAQHMESNRFRRVTRHFTNNMSSIVAYKVALDSSNDARYREALESYKEDGAGGRTDRLFQKINKWRPNKVAEQLVLNMKFNYGEQYTIPGTSISRQKLTSITINGKEIPVPENDRSLAGKIRHPYRYIRDNSDYRKEIKALLTSDSKLRNLMVRGDASRVVREVLGGVKLWRWTEADIKKAESEPVNTEKAAADEAARSGTQVTDYEVEARKAAASAPDGDVRDQAQATIDETVACAKDSSCVQELISEGDGVSKASKDRLASAFSLSGIRKVANGVSVAAEGLQMAALMCLFTGNGVRASQAVIAANSAMAVRTAASVGAAADQQKYTQLTGEQRVSASLVGGYVAQVGDIYNSNPERIASGRPVDTSDSPSPQAAANGDFATNSEIPIPSGATGSFNNFCSVAGNAWTVGIATTIEIVVSLIPGVGQAVKAGGTVTAKLVFKAASKEMFNLIKNFFTPKQLSTFSAGMSIEQLAAYFSRGLALSYAGAAFSGFAQGEAYVNQADAGMTVYGQSIDAVQNASLPLKPGEYSATDGFDKEFVAFGRQSQSPYNRYFAIGNADSLFSRAAMATYGNLRLNKVATLTSNTIASFNPLTLFSKLPLFKPKSTYADNPMRTFEYGVVPVGWTPDEEAAFLNDEEFTMFYNEEILINSGELESLEEDYGKCFSGDFAPLLADGDIVRNSEAEVLDGGDCDRKNMGDSGPPDDGKLTFASQRAKLGFRWRVWLRHHNTLDQMASIENPQEFAGTTPTGAVVVNIEGRNYSFPVGPQLKFNFTNVPCNLDIQPIGCHHSGSPGPGIDLYASGGGNERAMDNHPVYAFTDGTIASVNHAKEKDGTPHPECRSIQLLGDDGWYYAYRHIWSANVKKGQKVRAGDLIAKVAPHDFGSGCRGGRAHLHFDRGCKIDGVPQRGGSPGCRDLGVVPLMNQVWEALPEPAPGQTL